MKSAFRIPRIAALLLFFFAGNNPLFSAVAPISPVQAPAGTPASQAGQGFGTTQAGMADNTVGIVAAVQGVVEAVSPGQPSRTLKSGMPVFIGDQVSTDAQGHLQLLLRDETAFTLGASSSITIDEFVFDPSSNAGKISAKVGKGVFRFITGKISHKDPKNMTVKLPVGTIGIRGTIVAGKTEATKSRVYLLGPGENNNTGDRSGKIIVSNEIGNKIERVNITHPGFATTVEAGIPPTLPAQAPVSEIQSITNALQGKLNTQKTTDNANTPQGQNQPNATQQAKQDTFQALSDISNTIKAAEVTETADNNSNEAAQDKADNIVEITDGISTLQQLLTIQTGIYHFEQIGAPLYYYGSTSSAGSYDFKMDIDFGARTVAGGNSKAVVYSPSGTFTHLFSNPESFSYLFPDGKATHTWQEHAEAPDGNMVATFSIEIINSGGQAATSMNHQVVEYNENTALNEYEGGGNAPRQSGSAG